MTVKDEILTQIDNTKPRFGALEGELLARLFPPLGDSCRLVIACRKNAYAASIVARAVEDCDAHLLNLNVTSEVTDEGDMIVELRVGINNGESVARSLARYGYEVVSVEPETHIDNDTMRSRIDELMRYINM